MKVTMGLYGEPGASLVNKTGSWRSTQKPRFLQEKCTGCRMCEMVCPDAVVYALEKKKYTCNLDYCKGCGICAQECPVGDIKMVPEVDA
ncbi:MAG: 4Fe-4S binding protein [Sphingomonadaceae bacterium]